MKLVVTIPDNFYNFFNSNEFEKELKVNNALILFMQGKVSVSLAAELSGLDLYEFMYRCKQNKIPIYNLLPEDLDNELESFSFSDT